jgi:hypothetical protein
MANGGTTPGIFQHFFVLESWAQCCYATERHRKASKYGPEVSVLVKKNRRKVIDCFLFRHLGTGMSKIKNMINITKVKCKKT